jgi:acetyl esterase/lipase
MRLPRPVVRQLSAQRIAVTGDSAGGGLVMALVLRLRAAGEEPPGSIGLISPWLDLESGRVG